MDKLIDTAFKTGMIGLFAALIFWLVWSAGHSATVTVAPQHRYACYFIGSENAIEVTELPGGDRQWVRTVDDHVIPITFVQECMRVRE